MAGIIRRWLPILAILVTCAAAFFFQEKLLNLLSSKQMVSVASQDDRPVEMVTLLHKDAIPAIDNPRFLNVDEANRTYQENELILGVEIDGDARAYSVPLLSAHEIVNDTVGGRPIAVTW